jgi:Phosphotransferase enzyme family
MTFIEGQLAEQNEYRIVLVLPWSLKILLERHGHHLRLPRVRIPKWTRPAEEITEAIQAKWKVKSIAIAFLPEEQIGPQCCVIEVRTHDWDAAVDGLVPAEINDLDDAELTALNRATVNGILAGNGADRGPFSRLGWIDDARTWIHESLPDRFIEFSQDVRVLNASGPFALVRLGTLRSPAYWLKATGAPNAHEFVVTTTLARLFPGYLPPLVAARADWNAWVMEDIGRPLHDSFSLHSFELALQCLGELQKASAAHIETLVAGGCFDQRIPNLRAHLPELMRYLEEIMATQTSTKVLPIESKRLGVLKLLLEDAYIRMEAIGIPDTLLHNDMNTGNILVNGTRAVFTDWAEACVGNPFVTFQHLRIQAEREDATHTWSPSLTALYKQHWRTLLGESQIEEAFALVPPLAIASYLCGRDMSFSASYRNDTRAHSYARSLARHMDRAAQSPEFLEAVWP